MIKLLFVKELIFNFDYKLNLQTNMKSYYSTKVN